MFFFVALTLVLSTASSLPDQPPGCPFPTGPYVPPDCGKNEYFECSFKCPPQTCASLWSKLPCDPGDGCCINECRCIDGHFRNEDGECVATEDCYQSGSQASSSASILSSASGSQSSSSAFAQAQSSSSSNESCEPTKYPCIPTCVEPNPENCQVDPKYICEGANILSKIGGKCIKIEDCPQNLGCNGDENAVVMPCPSPCPSTCDNPVQIPCKRACLAVGCACKPGFILSDKGCIRPDCCPTK